MTLIERLESIGFLNLFTYRKGPCDFCDEILQTYYLPETKRWLCEDCYYKDSENGDFINHLELLYLGTNMASQMPTPEQMWAELQALKADNKKLRASREDNIFVGTTDNLTLKHRVLNPRAWGVPTKNQQGQGFFRCSDFPFNFDIAPDRKAVRVYTAIPASPEEVALFEQRFMNQQIVVAKRRQGKDESTAQNTTSQAFNPPQSSTAPASVAPSATPPAGPRSFAQLSSAEQQSYVAKATQVFAIPGLFKDMQSALKSVLPSDVTFP